MQMKIRHALAGIAAGVLLFVGAGAADAAVAPAGGAAQAPAVGLNPGDFTTNFFFNNNDLCLDADTGTLHNLSTKVQLWRCNGLVQQKWEFHLVPGYANMYTITNVGADDKCLDADTGTLGHNGTIVHLYECDDKLVQDWAIRPDGGTLYISNMGSGRFLDAASEHAGQNGDPVQLWNWNGGLASQRWGTA